MVYACAYLIGNAACLFAPAVGFRHMPAMFQVATADLHVLCMQTDLQKQEAAAQGKGVTQPKSGPRCIIAIYYSRDAAADDR
jgi:hypothetical protein